MILRLAIAAARDPMSVQMADVVVHNTGRWNDRAAEYSCETESVAQTEYGYIPSA